MTGDPANRIVTRVILQPLGGGQPVETFDSEESREVEVDTVLAVYSRRFGPPTETAYTQVPGINGPVSLGWVFQVPQRFEVPGPKEDFEMVLIPMFDDPESQERVSLFLRLAEQRQQFQEAFDRGDVDSFTRATLEQREPDEPPSFKSETQRRKS